MKKPSVTKAKINESFIDPSAPPAETKEHLFHRLMDRHFTILKARYRMMRKTINSRKVSAADADLIKIAIESECAQFVAMLKSRVEEESNGPSSIWQ